MSQLRKRTAKQDSSAQFKDENQITSETRGNVIPEKNNSVWLSSKWTLFSGLIALRLLNAAAVSSFFVPDEYWQSLEVAHRMVFGYGHLTWEWKQGLRGILHPLLFAILYKFLQITRLDSGLTLSLLPRLVQGALAAVSDYHLVHLGDRLFYAGVGLWALMVMILSWSSFYLMTRTLVNSLETVVVTVALAYWPWRTTTNNFVSTRISLSLAAVSCVVRPTAALLWLPMTANLLASHKQKVRLLMTCLIPIGIAALAASLLLDSLFYGKLTVVQWNFLKFNVLEDHGSFYGAHSWHWYFSAGLPMLLGTTLLPFLFGLWFSSRRQLLLVWSSFVVIVFHSFLSHKEFRFLLPLLPVASVYAGYGIYCLRGRSNKFLALFMVFLLAVSQLPAGLYLGTVHQTGTTNVMGYLRTTAEIYATALADRPSCPSLRLKMLFLMPCHSTPYYSHIHHNISLRYLECPPSEEVGYVDEAARFYLNPSAWLAKEYPLNQQDHLPTHIILFDVLQEAVSSFLRKGKYSECAEFFHSHFPEGRVGGHVLVFCRDRT